MGKPAKRRKVTMLRKLIRNMQIKIRTWNPTYFVNPFYSPSIFQEHYINLPMLRGFINGVNRANAIEGEWQDAEKRKTTCADGEPAPTCSCLSRLTCPAQEKHAGK